MKIIPKSLTQKLGLGVHNAHSYVPLPPGFLFSTVTLCTGPLLVALVLVLLPPVLLVLVFNV